MKQQFSGWLFDFFFEIYDYIPKLNFWLFFENYGYES